MTSKKKARCYETTQVQNCFKAQASEQLQSSGSNFALLIKIKIYIPATNFWGKGLVEQFENFEFWMKLGVPVSKTDV
eukprot:Pgem_evm1s9829